MSEGNSLVIDAMALLQQAGIRSSEASNIESPITSLTDAVVQCAQESTNATLATVRSSRKTAESNMIIYYDKENVEMCVGQAVAAIGEQQAGEVFQGSGLPVSDYVKDSSSKLR